MKNSQSEMILDYIKEMGSITQKDAYREFGCMRLSAQIYNLRGQGIPIKTTLETSRNRFGHTSCYARYSLCE